MMMTWRLRDVTSDDDDEMVAMSDWLFEKMLLLFWRDGTEGRVNRERLLSRLLLLLLWVE